MEVSGVQRRRRGFISSVLGAVAALLLGPVVVLTVHDIGTGGDQEGAPDALEDADLGPGLGDESTCSDQHCHWSADLLLRPGQTLATQLQREHQRPPSPVLSERHRSQLLGRRLPGARLRRNQQSASSNPGLAHTRRSTPHATVEDVVGGQCCDDRLKPPTPEETTASEVESRRTLEEPAGRGRTRSTQVRDREAPGSNPGPPTNFEFRTVFCDLQVRLEVTAVSQIFKELSDGRPFQGPTGPSA